MLSSRLGLLPVNKKIKGRKFFLSENGISFILWGFKALQITSGPDPHADLGRIAILESHLRWVI